MPGIHHAPNLARDLNLLAVPPGTGLRPNDSQVFAFNATSPTPIAIQGETNCWGLFAVLEEQFGDDWAVIDFEFLG